MARCAYRTLTFYDWEGHRENSGKRRTGAEPDRCLVVVDSVNSEDRTIATDEVGDDWRDFRRRVKPAVLRYLNALGADGWQVIHYDRNDFPRATIS